MTNDAKLGLLAGVATVLLVAVVSYRKANSTAPSAPPPAQLKAGTSPTPPPVSVLPGPVEGRSPADPLLRAATD